MPFSEQNIKIISIYGIMVDMYNLSFKFISNFKLDTGNGYRDYNLAQGYETQHSDN